MGRYFLSCNGYLVSHGQAPDGTEEERAGPGQTCMLGDPPGFRFEPTPYPGAQWHVEQQHWDDTRTQEQRDVQQENDILMARRAAYPPLADLADALYWQAQGDDSKMAAYHAAVAAVKARYPKA